MDFTGKAVLVTGASSGIGAAIAIKFAEHGANVTIVGRNKSKLDSVMEKCSQNGRTAIQIVADVTKDDDARKIVNETIKCFGKLDVLINNAGIATTVSILNENAINVFDRVMATNLRSAVYITNLAAPHLVETKGNIINISSIASIVPLAKEYFAYATSKACLDHFTRCVALELAASGVRVNSINPGPVRTDIVENSGIPSAYKATILENMRKATALDRIADPEEIADLALFLASAKARSITGSTYVSDNGALLKS